MGNRGVPAGPRQRFGDLLRLWSVQSAPRALIGLLLGAASPGYPLRPGEEACLDFQPHATNTRAAGLTMTVQCPTRGQPPAGDGAVRLRRLPKARASPS